MGIEAALIGGGLGLLGSSMAAGSAKSAAKTQAAAQTEAARIAAEEARFRPVGITTGFGSSNFTMGPDGRLQSAGYTLTPEMQAIRDAMIANSAGSGVGFTQQGQQAAQGLFNLGQGYLATSPEQAAQQWMQTQQAALAPSRQAGLDAVMNKLAQTGTQGLSVAQGTMGAANPLMQAFANAQAQQDLELAAQAQQQGRTQTTFGQGLLGGAFDLASGSYKPLTTGLSAAQAPETMGLQSLELGSALGGRNMNQTGAQALMQGGLAAANTVGNVAGFNPMGNTLLGMASNKDLTNSIANWFSGAPTTTAATDMGGAQGLTYGGVSAAPSSSSMYSIWN